jgi:hypothetical protein
VDQISNTCIRNARLSLFYFSFSVQFIPGKLNLISECLSRNPLWEEDIEDDQTMFAEVRLQSFLNAREDPLLEDLFEEEANCEDYQGSPRRPPRKDIQVSLKRPGATGQSSTHTYCEGTQTNFLTSSINT